MYGCDGSAAAGAGPGTPRDIQAFVDDRLFPWLMAQRAPEKFSFSGCKFRVRRCKEATGRVVMWRQMNIKNSFTMEAAFSGTTLDK